MGTAEIDKGVPDRNQSPSRRFTCPERTSGIRHEFFCCAVAVRPQQGTTPGRDSRLRRTGDGHQQQARSQERRLSSDWSSTPNWRPCPCHDSDTRRNRQAPQRKAPARRVAGAKSGLCRCPPIQAEGSAGVSRMLSGSQLERKCSESLGPTWPERKAFVPAKA